MTIWWAMWLAGCTGADVSGPKGLVGRVVDHEGAPVVGLRVESLEASDETGPDGAFSVRYKPPEDHVDFRWKAARYRRDYLPADEGRVVQVRLPRTADVALSCDRVEPCGLKLRWSLGDGLDAFVEPPCPQGAAVDLVGVPTALPEATCAAAPGEAPQPANLVAVEGGWVLLDAPRPVRVAVRTDGGEAQVRCAVFVGDTEAVPSGDGYWVTEAAGRVTVSARCDDRPALPEVLTVDADPTVTLEWSSVGPDLDLSPWSPTVDSVVLVAEGGWSLALPLAQDAVVRLPPLPAGRYRLRAGEAPPNVSLDGLPTDVVRLALHRRDGDTVVGLAGALVLSTDRQEGRLRVDVP